MRYRTRTWQHPSGWDGPGWSPKQGEAFDRLMRRASRKVKGSPRLVDVWDDGRGIRCWYSARAGADERRLAEQCREIFGARERDPRRPSENSS